MTRQTDHSGSTPLHVSLLALPDAAVSTLAGIFDVMNSVKLVDGSVAEANAPFCVEVVGEAEGPLSLASGVPFNVQRAVDTIAVTDIIIVPSVWRNCRSIGFPVSRRSIKAL